MYSVLEPRLVSQLTAVLQCDLAVYDLNENFCWQPYVKEIICVHRFPRTRVRFGVTATTHRDCARAKQRPKNMIVFTLVHSWKFSRRKWHEFNRSYIYTTKRNFSIYRSNSDVILENAAKKSILLYCSEMSPWTLQGNNSKNNRISNATYS